MMIIMGLMGMLFQSWLVNFFTLFTLLFFYLFKMNHNFSWTLENIVNSSSINNLMVFLSLILCLLALVSTPENKKSTYVLCIMMLMIILTISFSSENSMIFYIFFEASLIPTLLLVVSWGYQPERLQAGTYMMIYTVTASLPLLFLMMFRCKSEGTMMFMLFNMLNYSQVSLTIIISLAFLVKLPMYTFHLWLPKAHVEASLAGSMILAGILLKLGGFGLMQMSKMFELTGSGNNMLMFIMSLSFFGGMLASLMCMRQKDMKAFVAYSSISHMSLVIVGIMYDKIWGVMSALITMFAHGLSSSALFCLTYFTYMKVHSRSMVYMKGMLQLFPIISLFWFIFCSINMAVPPTLNLLGEMFVVPVMFSLSFVFMIVMGIMIFFSAVYNMYLYMLINHGFNSNHILMGVPLQMYQKVSLLFHLIPLLLVFKLEIFI
uniref:NADH dehydrogenase subunit 4 n=1 Tax=Bulinus truncatus TaxID=55810 RepID=UPI001EDF71B3|nr:NADH dehydrogenase subunit 4 [Bulinus truncatus]QYJ56638.1 NADH dehydrogenase subunit 4 [Bulinus truncatus]